MSVIPMPPAAGPDPGQPGHFAHHDWLEAAVLALDSGSASGQTGMHPRRVLTRGSFSLANNAAQAVGTWVPDTLVGGDDGDDPLGLTWTNPVLVAGIAGLYRWTYSFQFGVGATGLRRLYLYRNGVPGPPPTGQVVGFKDGQPSPTNATIDMTGVVYLNAGDNLMCGIFQNSGAAVTVGTTQTGADRFQVEYLGT